MDLEGVMVWCVVVGGGIAVHIGVSRMEGIELILRVGCSIHYLYSKQGLQWSQSPAVGLDLDWLDIKQKGELCNQVIL